MKHIHYLSTCMAMLIGLAPLQADKPQKPNDDEKKQSSFTHNLSRRHYPSSERSTFVLDIKTKQPNVTVVVWCDLRQDKRGVGRFRLERQETKVIEKNTVRYAISCLADQYIPDSKLRITIRDNDTRKSVGSATLLLRDAVDAPPRN